ncbi:MULTISPECIES: Hsp20/alpha crystallin family protein [Rhodanobacter]|uniref:Hsp20/alpha crystallin family protein n=1 Tax=Rhodanobacter hydrolyticus TaxID=2250595 RepID=A0ABW8J2H9_9GAMM|nr:Hsp20/alpha crystallin family protein [Rhodanobacter sp. 7MK24]MBD8879687.1 Hsp20/alpha crystallin family protein [Rhodanobacter sp. 7MK24]
MSLNHHVMWSLPRDARAFRHAFDRFTESGEAQGTAAAWSPRVDVREEAERFVIHADVPGVDPAAIDVSMDKNVLSISGERAAEAADASGLGVHRERPHGAFLRRFTLPESADAERITASNRHGVLEIAIPKKAESAPRRIVVDTAH